MANFFRAHYRAFLLAGALVLVALAIHAAPAWLSADASPEFPARGISRRLFLTGIGLTALVALAALLFKPAIFETRRIKSWLIFGVFLSGQVLLFLLPPFQGPDELAHWFTALQFNRPHSAEREPLLYNLPNTLSAGRIPQHQEVRFDPRLLRAESFEPGRIYFVNYANRLSYPFVSAVSLFFPRVQTMHEALLFFYLCRFLPLACLFFLLLYLNRRFELPYAAIWFFSLPLVMQQFAVVSTDTIVNFGVFAVVLLYERLERRADWRSFAALLAACLIVAGNKPVLWGLFAALLAFIPYRRIPAKFAVLPLAALASAAAVFFVGRYVGGMIVQITNTEESAGQAAAIVTREGFLEFWKAYLNTMATELSIYSWTGRLGWLDADLNAHHLSLIRFNFFLCLFLDAARYCFRSAEIRRGIRAALAAAGIAAFVFVTLTLSMCAILYVTWTPPHWPIVIGVQTRYWFPAVIFSLAIPLVLLPRDAEGRHAPLAVESGGGWRAHSILALDTSACVFFTLFLFARGVEMFVDLTNRYW